MPEKLEAWKNGRNVFGETKDEWLLRMAAEQADGVHIKITVPLEEPHPSPLYSKINTLWKRDKDNKFVIMPGEYSQPEFPNITFWEVTEKIDGMNIRVIFNKDGVRFAGRTDKAQLPKRLLEVLAETFTVEKMAEVFDLSKSNEVTLYGEGYGVKIQKGGGDYLDDQAFVLFDVRIDGIWLTSESVTEMAGKLEIKRVPILNVMPIWEIEAFVQSKPRSMITRKEKMMEGVVCRSDPLVLDRLGKRVIFKLKCKDYEQLERQKEAKK